MRLQAAALPGAPALRSRRTTVVAKAQASSSDVSRRGMLLSAAAAGLVLRPEAGAWAHFAHAAGSSSACIATNLTMGQ